MITELAESILNGYKNQKKIKIIKILTGKKATMYANKFFYNKHNVPKWKNKDIKKSLFFVYIRKKITKKYIGFKFIIGEDSDINASVIGEIHDYETGKIMLNMLFKN